MTETAFRILVLNPGSTSTKLAVFSGEAVIITEALRHTAEEMASFEKTSILDQLEFRLKKILASLEQHGIALQELHAVVGRGGLLKPLRSGSYRVNAAMLDDLRQARRGEHASNLGAFLAHEIASHAGCPAFIVDPVSVDEWPDIARFSGLQGLDRECLSHALNTKAIARRFAREQRKPYRDLRLIVAHLGSGFSISAHESGKMIDVTNSREEGAFSVERAGTLPVVKLVDLCFSGKTSRGDLEKMIFRQGGMYSYLQTKDFAQVLQRIRGGDARARQVFEAMLYQIAKEIGAMAAVLRGRVDAILLTGGLVHATELVQKLTPAIDWIAPVHIYAGEDELQALAEGALRVLHGEEDAVEYE